MALAFDPNRTFFRGIKQVQTNTSIYRKREGKGIKGRMQKEAGKSIIYYIVAEPAAKT